LSDLTPISAHTGEGNSCRFAVDREASVARNAPDGLVAAGRRGFRVERTKIMDLQEISHSELQQVEGGMSLSALVQTVTSTIAKVATAVVEEVGSILSGQ
jgi:bacteriocin-like protein